MQPLSCVCFLLGLAILSATLGPFAAIAHRELLMVTNSERGLGIKLEFNVGKTSTDGEMRHTVLKGRKIAFGDAVMKKKDARSKPSTGGTENYSTNSNTPSSLEDSISSTMKAGPSMDSTKLEGSTSELVLKVSNSQHMGKSPSKRNPSSGSNKELQDSTVHRTSHKMNNDWKEKMLEASDEVLRLLNRDYQTSPRRRTPVHN